MGEDGGDKVGGVEVLRVKGKVWGRVEVEREVGSMEGGLGNKYEEIEEVIKKIEG